MKISYLYIHVYDNIYMYDYICVYMYVYVFINMCIYHTNIHLYTYGVHIHL